MSAHVTRSLLLTLTAALLAWPIGELLAPWLGWAFFCGSLGIQLASHLRNFSRLERWSHTPEVDRNLEGEGAWDDVFGRVYRHEKDLREQIARRNEEITLLIAANQALNDGIVLLDRHNQIEFCNTMAEAQLGLKTATDRGAAIVNLVRQPEFAAYLEGGDHARPLILRFERHRVLSIHVMPYAGDRRLLQVKDITQTDRLDSMRRDFVANVSHELRTPLTVLAGFLETLQEIDVTAEERRHYLGLMAEQSKRMQSIVQDLLTLSAIESAPPPAHDLVEMTSLIEKLQRDATALSAGRHRIVVESDSQDNLYGSEPELVSAFGNLVANAIRYTPAGGTIAIQWRVSADTKGAEFAVSDTGIGIDPEHIPRLTERFYRVDRGRSRDAGGTGLGLAIVKHSLNRHQAQLEITSTPGKGSRFAARFPPARVAALPAD